MLVRKKSSDGIVWYESPLLAAAKIPHAFTTRIGGVSAGPFGSLNFGNPAGVEKDPQGNIDENYRRIQGAIDVAERKVLRVHQVHGASISVAKLDREFNCDAYAEAIVVMLGDQLASVRVADCCPVLLAAGDGRGVVAVHAGWRGVVSGIVPRAIEQLRSIFPNPEILGAVGPCIGLDAFEVGPEVAAAFRENFGDQAPVRSGAPGKFHIDLRAAIVIQLQRCGIPGEQVDLTDRCTFAHADEFFSHRRDHGITGRMVALIGLPR